MIYGFIIENFLFFVLFCFAVFVGGRGVGEKRLLEPKKTTLWENHCFPMFVPKWVGRIFESTKVTCFISTFWWFLKSYLHSFLRKKKKKFGLNGANRPDFSQGMMGKGFNNLVFEFLVWQQPNFPTKVTCTLLVVKSNQTQQFCA